MFTEGLGQALFTSHLIYCPTTASPPVMGISASMGGSISALRVQSPSQCFRSTLLNATSARGVILALEKFPVWGESRESGGGPSWQGQGAEGGTGQRGLLTGSGVSGMGLGPQLCLLIPGMSRCFSRGHKSCLRAGLEFESFLWSWCLAWAWGKEGTQFFFPE